jgi:hypothetical protein
MLLAVPALVALGLSLLTGGSLRQLAALPVRGGSLILLSFAVQLIIYLPGLRSSSLLLHNAALVYIAALGLVLAGALRNWHLGLAARVATLGLALNFLVIAANGGHMPVNRAALLFVLGPGKVQELASGHVYGNTQLAGPSTRLVPLSDVLPVRLGPGHFGNVYSIGDLLIVGGVGTLLFTATRRRAARASLATPHAAST